MGVRWKNDKIKLCNTTPKHTHLIKPLFFVLISICVLLSPGRARLSEKKSHFMVSKTDSISAINVVYMEYTIKKYLIGLSMQRYFIFLKWGF